MSIGASQRAGMGAGPLRALLPLGLASLAALAGCRAPLVPSEPPSPDLRNLAEWWSGSFSARAPSVEEVSDRRGERFFAVPIWTDRDDGPWLYVERGAAGASRPELQRVYRLATARTGLLCSVFELPGNPLVYAGAWWDTDDLEDLRPRDLIERSGCAIHLQRIGDTFVGATLGTACTRTLPGVAYVTAEIRVAAETLTIWERGFDEEGEQVFGPTAGPDVFERF